MLFMLALLVILCICHGFKYPNFKSIEKKSFCKINEGSNKEEELQKLEKTQVSMGLTHIKYNKFAPTSEEAASMTDEEFRAVIYKRMKEDERNRRKQGMIGSAVSDDYLASLDRPRPAPSDDDDAKE